MIDLTNYKEPKPHRVKRAIWSVVNATIFRCIISTKLRAVRNIILRMFGADLPLSVCVYPTCKIWAPWNLKMDVGSCIGPNTHVYNKNSILIGRNVTVSQEAFLCTAGHDIRTTNMELVTAPIILKDGVWVAARAFVGMGVTIGEEAVVGACACVFKDVEAHTVVGGNPAKKISDRILK